MVIRGNSRGNGRQLAHYLLAKKDNEHIRILDIDGESDPEASALHRALYSMDLTSELTKSDKGLYHAQINPAPGEDEDMTDEHWLQAANMLASELGLEDQRQAIVLHTKKDRTHAHVVWERYDHDKGRMISDSFSRLAQDRAREKMEMEFGHKPTPHRNRQQPKHKATISELWHQTASGAQFVNAAKDNGYTIAKGSGRRPFMVVDENARSFDLVRQIAGVKTKDVKERLQGLSLTGEKDAIGQARSTINETQQAGKLVLQQKIESMNDDFAANKNDMTQGKKPESTKDKFADNKGSVTGQQKQQDTNKPSTNKDKFSDNKSSVTGQEKDKTNKEKFSENKNDMGTEKSKGGKSEEQRREEIKKRKAAAKAKQSISKGKGKSKGPEMG